MSSTLKARPTTYKGTKMRSRMEAGFAQWLDQWNFDWSYEPECFAYEGGQYLPDFICRGVCIAGTARDIYMEVKPTMPTRPSFDRLTAQANVIAASQAEARMAVVFPQSADDWASPGVLSVPHFADWWWSRRDDGRLGLSSPIGFESGPWPDGYWEAK